MLTVRAATGVGLCVILVGCTSSTALRSTLPSATAPAEAARAKPAIPGSPAANSGNPGGLSDEQMVGQLFVSYVYGSGPSTATKAQRAANDALYGEPTPAAVVRRWHLGGVILLDHNNLDLDRPALSTGNVTDAEQLSDLTTGLQRAAISDSGLPLLIGTDQEGGAVQRIRFIASHPSEASIAGQPAATLACSYYKLGSELMALGVNQDYAPDADVVRSTGGIIGNRSFGADPARDATDVAAAVRGLQDAGVLATLKHWPGHGSTLTDSHAALAVIHETAEEWAHTDLPPFAAASTTAAAVMVGHLALPAIDPSLRPASLSPVLIQDLLRGQLKYQGLVITDSMWMQPIRSAGSPGAVAVAAVVAGNDMLLMPPDLYAATQAVSADLRANPGFRARVRTAVTRIIAAKHRVRQRPSKVCSD